MKPNRDCNMDSPYLERLWNDTDKLRGNMDAAKYKQIVLGLIFLKYVSDVFDKIHNILRMDLNSDPENASEYVSRGAFWIPKDARWNYLEENAWKPEIGSLIDEAVVLLENDNPSLDGVLEKNHARMELDKQRLGEMVSLLAESTRTEKVGTP